MGGFYIYLSVQGHEELVTTEAESSLLSATKYTEAESSLLSATKYTEAESSLLSATKYTEAEF